MTASDAGPDPHGGRFRVGHFASSYSETAGKFVRQILTSAPEILSHLAGVAPRLFENHLRELEIARISDLDVPVSILHDPCLSPRSDQKRNLVRDGSPRLVHILKKRLEDDKLQNLRSLHPPEILPRNRFDGKRLIVDPMEGIGDRFGAHGSAKFACGLIACGNRLRRNQRARSIVDRDENRPRIRETPPCPPTRIARVLCRRERCCRTLGNSACERLEFLDSFRGAHQNDVIDIRTIVKGGKTVRDERTSAKRSRNLVETHPAARARRDDDGGQIWRYLVQGRSFCTAG